jgi:peroxiredoxin Q/BCP
MKAIAMAFSAAMILGAARPSAAKMLAAGDSFPSWKLTDHAGKEVSSSDLAGKTYLLWFYPKAMTPGCTAEGQGLRDSFADFQSKGVEILGVSFDDPAANAAFVKAESFPFRLLSDRGRVLAVAVGAADSADQPVARRISYLVGPDGKVRRAYGTVTPAAHAGEVLKDLVESTPR